MIILTRLGAGLTIAVNPDLIERVEATPDTVVTLVDGHKLVVEQSLAEVVSLVRGWRASVAAEAIHIVHSGDVDGDGLFEPVTEEQTAIAAIADTSGARSQGARVLQMPHREV